MQVHCAADSIRKEKCPIWVYFSLEHLRPPSGGETFDISGYKKSMLKMKSFASNEKLIIPEHVTKMFFLSCGGGKAVKINERPEIRKAEV